MLLKNNVTARFGNPITIPVLIPVEHRSTPMCIDNPFMVNGECYRVTAMSFETPHGAVFTDDLNSVNVPSLGQSLGTHPLFPRGASIVFIRVLDRENIEARLWQYDKGETAYTPEAACVAGAAAMMCQKTLFNELNVSMYGHLFRMKWDRLKGEVTLTNNSSIC